MIEGALAEPAEPRGRVRHWVQALDAMERDLRVAERMLARTGAAADVVRELDGGWQAPSPEGALPASLVDRADELVRRQAAVRDGLAEALEASRVALAGLRHGEAPTPAYVDISA